jgi:hypothetical protein
LPAFLYLSPIDLFQFLRVLCLSGFIYCNRVWVKQIVKSMNQQWKKDVFLWQQVKAEHFSYYSTKVFGDAEGAKLKLSQAIYWKPNWQSSGQSHRIQIW